MTRTLTRRPWASIAHTMRCTSHTTRSLMLSFIHDRRKPACTYGRVNISGLPRAGGCGARHACAGLRKAVGYKRLLDQPHVSEA